MIGKDVMRDSILLIRPPTVTKGASFIATQFPLNIASIAATLLEKGYDTKIWDFDVRPFTEEAFKKEITAFSPFIVGISCYTPTIINGHKIAALVRKYLPNTSVIVGGPHVSALPEETLGEFQNFDIGVIGEGEEVMLELADKLLKKKKLDGTQGLIYRENGSLRKTEKRSPIKDLDTLPFPARQPLLDISAYRGQSHRGFSRSFLKITEIMTSRGCPNRCIFCASDVVMDRGVRFRSADSVKREIAECVEKYGFNHFTISDDTFILREDRLYDICDEFSRHRVTWNCNARVWPISQKMLFKMAGSGCTGITFGVESGSPRILELIGKNITLEQVENAFRWSKEAGIKLVEADVIIGSHPSETREDVKMTQKLLRKISPDITMISIIVPYPGTQIYYLMQKKNLIFQDKKWETFVLFGREPSWRTENFSAKELVLLQKKMILHFYFRPLYILRILKKIKSRKELFYWLRAGSDFLLNCIRNALRPPNRITG